MRRSIHTVGDFDTTTNHIHSTKHAKRSSIKSHTDSHSSKHRNDRGEPEEALSSTDPTQIDFVRMESLIDPDIDKQGHSAAASSGGIQVVS